MGRQASRRVDTDAPPPVVAVGLIGMVALAVVAVGLVVAVDLATPVRGDTRLPAAPLRCISHGQDRWSRLSRVDKVSG